MSAKKKHSTADQYLLYLKGELSNRERFEFEQGLEADPFEMEAMEGMENLNPDQASEDILSLHVQLRKRLARRRRITFYSVAASIASLLIIGTVFLQIYDFNPDTREEKTEQELPVLTDKQEDSSTGAEGIPDEKEIIDQEKVENTRIVAKEKPTPAPVAVQEKKGERTAKGAAVESEQVAQPAAEPEAGAEALPEAGAVEGDKLFFAAGEEMEIVEIEAVENEMIVMEAKPKVDQFAAAPARSAEARDETEGIARKRAKSANEAVPLGFTDKVVSDSTILPGPAVPSIGQEAFEKYMEDHLVYPDTLSESSREVVILNFTVTASGKIINFEAIGSPGKVFTEEAIRLIEEGPSWIPATNAHGATEEVVRLRIVFNRDE